MAVATRPIPLGGSVPADTPHAISVSLPKWADNVGYEEGDKRVVGVMETGYPRFFIHRSIQKLAALCEAKFGRDNERCILLPSQRVAREAKAFLASQTISSRIVEFAVCPSQSLPSSSTSHNMDIIELQILLFDKENFPLAKSFWQHTGDGISSRMAEKALYLLGETPAGSTAASPTLDKDPGIRSSRNRHYSRYTTPLPSTSQQNAQQTGSTDDQIVEEENLTAELSTYLEERYGRNLPTFNAPLAKQALKRRIAGGLLPSDEGFGSADVTRGKGNSIVKEEDVYLYPGGMSAIWHAHDISRIARRAKGEKEGKSVCFGFPYTDTYKILSKWGPGCHFYGHGGAEDLAALEKTLETQNDGKILALFAEFPSNPLLRSPDLVRIRELADRYGFIVVVDETIGNFINVEIMEYVDIVVSSLTKIFSGDSNVMGGSLVLNPNGPHYDALKFVLDECYEDLYFAEDVVYMERNSRNYRERIRRVNDNAYDVTEYLHSRSLDSGPGDNKVIKKVWYPRYSSPETYEKARRLPTLGKGGYGGLFSLTFTSLEASQAFFDALQCAKGPSLGTSFTLASPYTILAHYLELDWAAQFGVEAGLVRISVGQEDGQVLRSWFEASVKAAEEAGARR
ncbi:putative cystathionine gamma-synthase [Kockovaella imperatae]|uniref:cystathionine gamma-synthase n=1 Tax=Kockovaella imperatae TaxID=4999 RepID=A0A1Y1U6I1_9TREE|nr:putative cystathionine gamma-synthase [Kockovaella imperatae]ORX33640.1 putative cystathionine gamma-synthase [Kockovaella imperatae]